MQIELVCCLSTTAFAQVHHLHIIQIVMSIFVIHHLFLNHVCVMLKDLNDEKIQLLFHHLNGLYVEMYSHFAFVKEMTNLLNLDKTHV